jgi:uncharacterized protein (TIGR02147 family)
MSLFDENDYKEVIKNLVIKLGPQKRGFSTRLAAHLNINPSLVSQILAGNKDFTEEQMVLTCEYLGLSDLESRYLLTLVQISRAGSVKLKNYYQTALAEIRARALNLSNRIQVDRKLTGDEKTKFYSSWIYSAVHLTTTLKPAPKFQDICQRFAITRERAQEVINFLLEIGMILEKDSRYYPGPVITHLDKVAPEIPSLHKNWRQKSMEAAERLTPEEFMYSCNFTIGKKDFLVLREELVQLTKRFLDTVAKSEPEEMAQFNIDLFWLRR